MIRLPPAHASRPRQGPASAKLRIIHGPVNVADQGPAIALLQRRLGADAVSFDAVPHPFYGPADFTALDAPGSQIARVLAQSWGFYKIAQEYDVIHLHWSAFLPPIPWGAPHAIESAYLSAVTGQLHRLRSKGKLLVAHFHGSDVRPESEISREWLDPNPVLSMPEFRPRRIAARVRYAQAFASSCDLVYVSTPDLLPFVPRAQLLPVVPSRAFSAAALRMGERTDLATGETLRVLHAPSSTALKGSGLITETVDALRARGVPLELTLLQGEPTSSVLSALLETDVLIDQINVGWYGALAVEGMLTGVPTIARLTSRNRQLFEQALRVPVDRAILSVDDGRGLARMLEALAAGNRGTPQLWREMSRSAVRFARAVHDGPTLAGRLLDDYRDAL